MHFCSLAIGSLNKMIKTINNTVILEGEDKQYQCELVPGDKVFIVNIQGIATEDALISANFDKQTLEFEKSGELNFKRLVFIGKIE